MPNLIINNVCNLNCPFCFASESQDRCSEDDNMSLETFKRFVNKFFTDAIRICGGEPSLHPQFLEMLDWSLTQTERDIYLISNAAWPDHVIDYFTQMSIEHQLRFTYLFNILEPTLYSLETKQRVDRVLSVLAPDSMIIGLTIYKPDFDYQYLIQIAKEHDIKTIRYSVAACNISDPDSRALHPGEQFKSIANTVYRMIIDARYAGIKLFPDCGYVPPCFFSKDQIADLNMVQSDCLCATVDSEVAAPIDISATGETWRCYGMYSLFRANANNFKDKKSLERYFARRMRLLENFDLFEQCRNCSYKANRTCGGGCFAHKMRHIFQKYPNFCYSPLDNDDQLLKSIPVKEKTLTTWTRPTGQSQMWVNLEDDRDLIPSDDETFKFLNMCNGHNSVKDISRLWGTDYDKDDPVQKVLELARSLFELDAITFRYNTYASGTMIAQGTRREHYSDLSFRPIDVTLETDSDQRSAKILDISESRATLLLNSSIPNTNSNLFLCYGTVKIECRMIFQTEELLKNSNEFRVAIGFDKTNSSDKMELLRGVLNIPS